MSVVTGDLIKPRYETPDDLAAIETVPLAERGLPVSTYALLARAARLWPDRIALQVLPSGARWDEPVRRTFAELLGDVHRVANLLHRLGVRRSDAVGLMTPNCAGSITATLAAQLAGVAAPVNADLSPEHVGELLRRSGARVLIVAGPELAPTAWTTAQQLVRSGEIDVLLVLRPSGSSAPAPPLPLLPGPPLACCAYLDDLAAAEDASRFVGDPPRSADVAAFFHTGGTTGAPKLAAHTHGNEVADAWMLAANSLLEPGSVVFAALPLFHVNALVVTLLAPLYKGQRAVWAGPLGYRDPALLQHFWRIVEHYRIATMSAVPTVYAALARIPVDADIRTLRFAMVGAAPLPPAVRTGFESRAGVPLLEGYGLTEATCASARSFPDAPRPGSVGQRLPYQSVRAVRIDDAGAWHDLPPGEVGVLVIAGPTVFPGYLIGRDEHGYRLDGLGKLVGGWLDTGDLARVDEDGFVFLCGRAKDLIIRGGHNIDPCQVEDALLTHPGVVAAAAVGRPDVHAGELPVAYAVLGADAAVTEAELLAWVKARIGERVAIPKSVTVVDALPATAIGKPYKLALRADATRRALTDALAGFPGVAVDAVIDDGSVVATITVDDATDTAAVTAVLDRYAVCWRLATLSGAPA